MVNSKEEIISKGKLQMLPKEEQVRLVRGWRKKYSTKEIVSGMGLSTATYYKLVAELGLSRGYGSKKKKYIPEKVEKVEAEQYEPAPQIIPSKQVVEGMVLAYAGIYSADEITNKMEKMGLMLSDESNKFEVEIKIREITTT